MKLGFIHIVYTALAVGIVVSTVSMYGVVSGLQRELVLARSDFRDDIVWYSTQYRAELNDLITALQDRLLEKGISTSDVVDRFDVFWSRLEGTGSGSLGREFAQFANAKETVGEALAVLQEHEAMVLALDQADNQEIQNFIVQLRNLHSRFQALARAGVRARLLKQEAHYLRQSESTTQILAFLGGVLVLGGSLVILLRVEKAKVESLHSDLERRVIERTEELSKSEQRYRTLVENAPEAIVVLDVEQEQFVDVNDNACKLFGLDRKRLIGKNPVELSPPKQPDGSDSGERARALITGALHGERPVFEWVHRNMKGEGIPCEIRLVKLPATDRLLVRGSVTDITKRRRNQLELVRYRENLEGLVQERTRELEAAQHELLKAERLATIGQLTGTVSHELRNPLGTIATSCSVLRNRLINTEPNVIDVLERIERNIRRCNGIIEELLNYTNIRELELEQTDVDGWVESMAGEMEIPEQVAIVYDLRSGVSVWLDRERMRQVLVNLIDNAWQSMTEIEHPVGPFQITVSSETADKRVLIHVSDTGIGIPEDSREAILEPLYSTRSFGVGLGLPLVRQIMERHGGGIELGPLSESGATFTVWLPFANRDALGEAI